MASALSTVAQECDAATRAARQRLVAAVRQAAADGMSQKQIAAEIGRSQPEVSRLLRFHGTSPLGRRLRQARPQIRHAINAAGGSKVRVFGSVAAGTDDDNSDVDLLFHMGEPLSLMELSALELELQRIIGARVDLVADTAIRPTMRSRILSEAVPL
ncbi:nucleotidyltransferase domain-containing protein [Actinomyces timonensis]|uniref:nucleotidyltransferase domain-containing protein n=1 Tax=Actinomyces timonensis TaxID=1288391 RepID=UPI0003606180|nr:nucleotidyltransferase domain-containing protein [Actinomyces timonensis]